MEKRNPIVLIIYKNILLCLFFFFFLIIASFFTFLENLNDCFPVTVITTDRTQIDNIINKITPCQISIDSEKMTFDSAIFNHYETPPVKDIYLFYLSIPHSSWDLLKNIDNAISDTNPYVEKTITLYNSSRIKFFSIAFVIVFAIGLIFSVKIAPSWKKSKRNYFITAFFTLLTFVFLSSVSYSLSSPRIYSFITVSLLVFLVTYLIILAIIYRLISIGDPK